MSITELATPAPAVPESCQGLITSLIRRCGQGDEAALGELFDVTFFLVLAVVRGGIDSPTGVDDEVVEAFRRIWGRSADYRPTNQGVLAWIFDQVVDRQVSPRHAALLTSWSA